jgi:hypothetical protein
MSVGNFNDLLLEKKNDIAVLLGSGSSINDLTVKQWEKIITYDFWTMNNFVYMPIIPFACNFPVIPNFYHIEVKTYDKDIVRKHFDQKWDYYKNCNIIIPKKRFEFIREAVGHLEQTKFFIYDFDKRDEKRADKANTNADYKIDLKTVVKSYDASVTGLLDMMYKFGYKKIIMIGFDMTNSKYFWTDHPEFGEVHDRFNKEREATKTADQPHNASHVKNFIIDFNRRHMIPNKREIVVGNTKTALYPDIRFEKII